MDVEKDSYTKRRVAIQATKSRQGICPPSVAESPEGGPFNLSGFFPTSLSAIEGEEEEWRWLRGEGEEGKGEGQRYRGEEEGPVRGGRSAIFGEETSDAIKGEDKMGVLTLSKCLCINPSASPSILDADRAGFVATEDVSLFGASTGESDAGYGRLMSPYASDEVLDENSLYLAQRARRERSDMSSAVGGSGGYGEVFLGE